MYVHVYVYEYEYEYYVYAYVYVQVHVYVYVCLYLYVCVCVFCVPRALHVLCAMCSVLIVWREFVCCVHHCGVFVIRMPRIRARCRRVVASGPRPAATVIG